MVEISFIIIRRTSEEAHFFALQTSCKYDICFKSICNQDCYTAAMALDVIQASVRRYSYIVEEIFHFPLIIRSESTEPFPIMEIKAINYVAMPSI